VVNKNKAYSWGLSANVNASFGKYVSFSSLINYTYGRIKESPDNYPLDHVPPTFGKTSITGSLGKFNVELFALYNAAKDSADYNLRGEDNQQYSADPIRGFYPAWATANFRAGYRINKYAALQIAVENIFDKYYRVFASGLGAPGRNLVLTLRGNF
jgi:hemoglobin/transferrin/lactoferrin receptor protein